MRLRARLRCGSEGHQPLAYGPTIVQGTVLVRCDCGRRIRPRLVYVEPLPGAQAKDQEIEHG